MEPLLLGLSSGLVCVVSCSPVLLPYLVLERRTLGETASLLARFLGGRLLGYLGFAVLAWAAGLALSVSSKSSVQLTLFAAAHLALAAALVVYGVRMRDGCGAGCASGRAVRLPSGPRRLAPVALGLLTGLSPCAPFLAAGVRAAERQSLLGALAFFALFFVGTCAWFVPFAAVAGLHRVAALSTIARFTTFLIGAYYAYLGAVALGGVLLHGS